MSRPTMRVTAAVLLLLSLTAAACGNSSEDDAAPAAPSEDGQSAPGDGGGEAERDTFVEISGVPGVTDDEIAFAAIGTRTGNPLGICILDCYLAGIQAYFDYRNDEGGIYGRDLVLRQELDDELGQNQVRALDVISGDDALGVFNASLLASGWGDLDAAQIPTYTWGIHSTEAANRQHIFPSVAARCGDCTSRAVPYAVKAAGAKKFASLGYGISENSKVCAQTVAASVELYADDIGAEVAYVNDELEYGLSGGIGPEVTAMKAAGVDFISTCIDMNGMKTLAQELERQGMGDVPMYHPNSYSQAFVAEVGGAFDGDFVSVQFLPFEAEAAGTPLEEFLSRMEDAGSEPSELSMVGWINASLAFDGLLAAGPEFDRAKVVEATNRMTEFTAGGLIEPIDWSQAHTPYTQATREVDQGRECAAMVRIEDGEFTTVGPPEKPWLCWDNSSLEWAEPVPTSFG